MMPKPKLHFSKVHRGAAIHGLVATLSLTVGDHFSHMLFTNPLSFHLVKLGLFGHGLNHIKCDSTLWYCFHLVHRSHAPNSERKVCSQFQHGFNVLSFLFSYPYPSLPICAWSSRPRLKNRIAKAKYAAKKPCHPCKMSVAILIIRFGIQHGSIGCSPDFGLF